MGIDDLERLFKSIAATKAAAAAAERPEPVYDLLGLLRFIAGGSPEVPSGWVRLQREAQHRLTAAMSAVPGRSAIRVTAVCPFSSQPAFRLTTDDAVVRGIYRRTLAKARHTCQACGRAGRVWESLSQHRVLCPRCAAPGGRGWRIWTISRCLACACSTPWKRCRSRTFRHAWSTPLWWLLTPRGVMVRPSKAAGPGSTRNRSRATSSSAGATGFCRCAKVLRSWKRFDRYGDMCRRRSFVAE